MASEPSLLMQTKLQKLVEDNTRLSGQLGEEKHKNSDLEGKLSLAIRDLAKEREATIIIKDCVVLFANSSTVSRLIASCVKYILNYFEPTNLTFYLKGNADGSEGVTDDAYMGFDNVQSYGHDKSMHQTPLEELEDIIHQMTLSQQMTKVFTSLDLKLLKELRTHSALLCRLKNANHTLGYVLLEFTEEKALQHDSLLTTILELFTSSYMVLLLNLMLANKYESAKVQAHIDLKTGCYNARKLKEDLIGLGEQTFTLVSVDVDKFKGINDTYGHDMGDDVLKYFGEKFDKHMQRLGGNGYREGGDEFIGISHSNLEKTEQAIKDLMAEVFEKVFYNQSGARLQITNSIGVYQRKSGESIELVKKKADLNLYKSKNDGRARYTVDQEVQVGE